MKSFSLGVLLGTIAMFIFGAVFWSAPAVYRMLPAVPDEAAAGAALNAAFPGSGTYLIPNPAGDSKRVEELSRKGPVAMVHLRREGLNPMEPRVFVQGFIHELVTVAFLALLLKIALPALGGYLARVIFLSLLGITAALYSNFSMPVWWHHPWTFYLLSFVYDVGAWVAAALVLAAFVKPVPEPR